jgi:hypothetical protein
MFYFHSYNIDESDCGIPILLPTWPNMSTIEGGTAIFKCPLDTSSSCLVDFVEWYRLDEDGDRSLIRDHRVEVFAFDPLLM